MCAQIIAQIMHICEWVSSSSASPPPPTPTHCLKSCISPDTAVCLQPKTIQDGAIPHPWHIVLTFIKDVVINTYTRQTFLGISTQQSGQINLHTLKYISFCFASVNERKGKENRQNASSSHRDGSSYSQWDCLLPPLQGIRSTGTEWQRMHKLLLESPDLHNHNVLLVCFAVPVFGGTVLLCQEPSRPALISCNPVLLASPMEEWFQQWKERPSNQAISQFCHRFLGILQLSHVLLSKRDIPSPQCFSSPKTLRGTVQGKCISLCACTQWFSNLHW